MKPGNFFPVFFAALVLFGACAGQHSKIVFRPPVSPPELPQGNLGGIVESQNGPAGAVLPEWVQAFLDGGVRETEALSQYQDKYVFVGENRGGNFNALRQWADNFSAQQDFPQLAAARVEKRLTAAAALYPDDEYGEYFAVFIKKIFDAEYPGAATAGSFWIKRNIIPDEEESVNNAPADMAVPEERYEYLVLTIIEKTIFQAKIRELMGGIKTSVPPTQSQAAAIKHIQQSFFEGF